MRTVERIIIGTGAICALILWYLFLAMRGGTMKAYRVKLEVRTLDGRAPNDSGHPSYVRTGEVIYTTVSAHSGQQAIVRAASDVRNRYGIGSAVFGLISVTEVTNHESK